MACDCYAHNVSCSGTSQLANHLINATNEQLSAKMKMQQEQNQSHQSAQQMFKRRWGYDRQKKGEEMVMADL